jgi:hypothetical protein
MPSAALAKPDCGLHAFSAQTAATKSPKRAKHSATLAFTPQPPPELGFSTMPSLFTDRMVAESFALSRAHAENFGNNRVAYSPTRSSGERDPRVRAQREAHRDPV